MVLKALERMLRGMRHEWQMQFAQSATEALEMMDVDPADVVITDMRMPGMSGAELLNEILQRHPRTVRVVLSGYADMEMTMRCVGGTHQFLAKPCDGEILRSVIRRAMELDDWLDNPVVKSLVSQMTSLPSLPSMYFQILHAVHTPEASIEDVGATIARDPAMAAKILQLGNSAFFGLGHRLSHPSEAVLHLGLETIKSLVLSTHAFSVFEHNHISKGLLDRVCRHSMSTAGLARDIALLEGAEKRVADESFTAGLLHDIGRLALAANVSEQYSNAVARHKREEIPLVDAERAVFGTTHAEAGGYLLGLWGLPVSIVEPVVFHHDPSRRPTRSFNALVAVHVANFFQHQQEARSNGANSASLDEAFLAEAGVRERVPVWSEALGLNQFA